MSERTSRGCRNLVLNQLEQYCKNCPNIEPRMVINTLCRNGEAETEEIIITCKYSRQCEALIKYLEV